MSQAVDVLCQRYPRLKDLFVVMAYSMWVSYPRSIEADAYLVLYDNHQRMDWFKANAEPVRAGKVLVPIGNPDFINEAVFAPAQGVRRIVDVLTVANLYPYKNLPVLAQALKIYQQKYRPLNFLLITGRSINQDELSESQLRELRTVQTVLADCPGTFEIETEIARGLLPQFYSRAKVVVLASLIEGANRSIREAMCCDTPVVCFADFNHYGRGADEIFPQGAGLYAPQFTPEVLADTIQAAIGEGRHFEPRASYLQRRGRLNFFNHCLDALPYYRQNLPEFKSGCHHESDCIITQVKQRYGVTLREFLYDEPEICFAKGIANIGKLIASYEDASRRK